MKNYKDFGIYDFSDYAEEIKGDALFKINGGSTSCSNEAPSAPPPSPTPKESAPAQTTTTTTTPAPSPAQTTTTPSGPTGPSSSDVPENIRNNSQAYAYYMQKQDEAKRDKKDSSKYFNYNVLGQQGLKVKDMKAFITKEEDYIMKESEVKEYLEDIIQSPENYSIEGYQRRALGEGKKDSLRTHSLYVIKENNTDNKKTLSFNGTAKFPSSKGAWVINTETDVSGYNSLLKGNNSYDMSLIYSSGQIDVQQTAQNIIQSINSNTGYYGLDHIINYPYVENCNTAFSNTVKIQNHGN